MSNSNSTSLGLVELLKHRNIDIGSLHSRKLPYLPAPFCLEREPTDWLTSENTNSPASQVGVKGLGQHLHPSTE